MKQKIKKTVVDKIRKLAIETHKRIYVYDTELMGFGFMATQTGKVSYFAEFRFRGKKRRKKIGNHGSFTPDQARNEAKGLLGDVARNIDITEKPPENISLKDLSERYLKQNAEPTRYWDDVKKSYQ